MLDRHDSWRRTLHAALAFALTYLMVWGGIPIPALAEAAEEAVIDAQSNAIIASGVWGTCP